MPTFDIHHATCFYYLEDIQAFYREQQQNLKLNNSGLHAELKKILEEIKALGAYDPSSPKYEILYYQFQNIIEKIAQAELNNEGDLANSPLDALFIRVYENKNQIKEKLGEHLGTNMLPNTSNEVRHLLAQKTKNTSKNSFSHPDNRIKALFSSMLGIRYHPLKFDNIPYMNDDVILQQKHMKNLRFGNQTHAGGKVNPTFKRYLVANARRKNNNQPVNHVYINLLKRDQKQIRRYNKSSKIKDRIKHKIKKRRDKFVRRSEGARARALESLNNDSTLKVAVITLPADNDFLLDSIKMKNAKEETTMNQNMLGIFSELVMSIQQDQNDFYMSKKVKQALFGNDFLDAGIGTAFHGPLGELFKKAVFEITGKTINSQQDLMDMRVSPKERSAILFHFTKHHLTSHILHTLNPNGFNITCKDAIDRGAIHNLWLTINLRHEAKRPLSESEFLSLLESPAMIVKFRGLNHNKNLIWNVINERINHDPLFEQAHPYLRKWVEQNNPQANQDASHRKAFILSDKGNLKDSPKPQNPVQQTMKDLAQEAAKRFKSK